MIDVIPGIFAHDSTELIEKIKLVAPFSRWIHLDLADSTYTSSISVLDPKVYKEIITNNHEFEAHLMVSRPDKYIRSLVDDGIKRLVAQVECDDPRLFLDQVRYETVEVGLAIDVSTELEEIEPYLEEIDFVSVLTTEAGAAGLPFQNETIEKIKIIHQNAPDLAIEVAGGINPATAKLVREAGATRIVSESYIFHDPGSIAKSLEALANS